MVKLISFTEYEEARLRAHKLIERVRKHRLIDGHYTFFCRPIGSQVRRCVVKDKDGKYDLDYQIVLTKHSKEGDSNPTEIKKAFLRAFMDNQIHNERVEDSTTVITIRNSKSEGRFDSSKEKFSLDFVIISIDGKKRIRRNDESMYTWVQLPSRNTYIYDRFNRLDSCQQRDLLENYLLPKIINEKRKNEDLRIPTVDLFYQAVNNYYQELKYDG